jgi:parallel beta-helix repeat protein
VLAPAAGAATSVTCGDTISTPGNYFLAADCSGSGITITASNVTLKLDGHTMTEPGGISVGVLVDDGAGPVSGVNILGPGTITGYNEGVLLGNGGGGVSGSTARRLTATYNHAEGIFIFGGTGDTISGNAANHNSIGVRGGGSGNVIQGNTADNNALGITVAGTGNRTNANTTDNNHHGIFVGRGTTGNTINANTTDHNSGDGIILEAGAPYFYTTGNTINANTADNNGSYGIQLVTGATGNTINANTALGNPVDDLFDDNPGCDSNVWNGNKFNTANQTCIH